MTNKEHQNPFIQWIKSVAGTLFITLMITGCLSPVQELYPEQEQKRPISVYIISHGWHTALVLEGDYLRSKLPKHEQLPKSKYLMVSWGDNKYFPSERARVDLFLRAAFLPTGSVIHLTGLDSNVTDNFPTNDIIQVQVSEEGMKNLSDYLSAQFDYNSNGDLQFVADGHYMNSVFFKTERLYYFPRTSNKWTARVLRKSGFPITPFYAITSGNVIRQARKSGEVIQHR